MNAEAISRLIDNYILYQRGLGHIYETQEYYLRRYQKYIDAFFPNVVLPDKESVDSFLDTFQGKPGGMYNAMTSLREFSRYLLRIGFKSAYLIPPKQMPVIRPHVPYFFAEHEISVLFGACDAYFVDCSKMLGDGLVFPAELRLLYCCGLRPKETRMLEVRNVHLKEKYIDIIQSKGTKDRRIYISDELAEYLSCYENAIGKTFPNRAYFFPGRNGQPHSTQFLIYNFKRIWGIAFPEWEGKLPRVYDFRHHFAWATINRWARDGADINTMIPYLMRYMGHNKVKNTLYYFRFVPDFYSDYKEIAQHLENRIPEVPYE